MTPSYDALLKEKNEQVLKLQRIVEDTMREEQLIANNLLHPPKEIITRGQKLSDRIARFGGSWAFIVTFLIILLVWIALNALHLCLRLTRTRSSCSILFCQRLQLCRLR